MVLAPPERVLVVDVSHAIADSDCNLAMTLEAHAATYCGRTPPDFVSIKTQDLGGSTCWPGLA